MSVLLSLCIFFFAVIIHEYSHGWVAWKLGDSTARFMGRLTLNPLAHIDPIGTIFLPLILIMTHSPVLFGWAKPVPVDFFNLNNPKRDMVWVGLAGPAANLIFAILLSLLLKIPFLTASYFAVSVITTAIMANLVLAVFNLLPIPPLDGSRVAMGLLPYHLSAEYAKIEPYGFIIIFALLWIGAINTIIWPIVISLARLLGVNF
ncbi:MAG: site-2 protease family protein [Candidatus Omnitrophica bacterium CG22_combo_CG10-13_8_21_14_all_43_16]|nr:MAG: site-2 protease family protein [Candidatus Omnitrophica bacterium CG22_combo_CG10-13_8_21_14_all_43_16]